MGSKGIFITSERNERKTTENELKLFMQQKAEICEKEISFLINPIF